MSKNQKEDLDICEGYLRQPHSTLPVLYLQYPDGTRKGLCQVCSTRWLLSDEPWPPEEIRINTEKQPNKDKTPCLASSETLT